MNIDISKFEKQKKFVIGWFNTKGGKNIERTISMMAVATFIPCIVIAYWIGEETNWDPQAVESIKRLTDFYGYKEIKGKPPGSPV